MTFKLNGRFLTSDYDDEADILYLWVDEPKPAVTYETSEGHLVQLDPETREFIGVAIMDFEARWAGRSIEIEVPTVEHQMLVPAGA